MRFVLMLIAISVLAQAAGDGWRVQMDTGDKLRGEGRYREALQAYGNALAEASAPAQPDPWEVASAHNGLGATWLALLDFRRAEPHLRHALSAFETLSRDQPESAIVLINLVTLLGSQGRFVEAAPSSARATEILERAYGPEHPLVATGLNSRGELLFQMSRCREAQAAFERAHAIWAHSLGSEHALTATALNNIGNAHMCLGSYREARRVLEIALRSRERALPPQHPGVAQSLYSYATVLDKLGQRREAQSYRKRADVIRARHAIDNLIGGTVDASAFR